MLDLFRRGDIMLVFYKKMLRTQGCVFLVCISFLIFDGYMAFTTHYIWYALAFGMFIVNSFWTLIFFGDLYSDYKLEKHRNSLNKEMEDKHDLENNIKFLKDKQAQYHSMISIMEKAGN